MIPDFYKAWKEIWKINVTTTENYPYFSPAYGRRGFHYDGVQVSEYSRVGYELPLVLDLMKSMRYLGHIMFYPYLMVVSTQSYFLVLL